MKPPGEGAPQKAPRCPFSLQGDSLCSAWDEGTVTQAQRYKAGVWVRGLDLRPSPPSLDPQPGHWPVGHRGPGVTGGGAPRAALTHSPARPSHGTCYHQ